MRLKIFLNDDEKTFQKLKIGLVEAKSDYDKVIRNVSEKHQLSNEIIDLRNNLNAILPKFYQGKFKFDFCLQEDINIDDLVMIKKSKLKDRLKAEVFGSNDKLAQSKTNIERKITQKEV